MGNQCTTCNTCSDNPTVEFVFGNCYLEPYQNESIPHAKLDPYSFFFRITCAPLHQINASIFFNELEALNKKMDMEHQLKTSLKKEIKDQETYWFNQKHYSDSVPFEIFEERFSQMDDWRGRLNPERGSFYRILQTEELNFDIKSEQKKEKLTQEKMELMHKSKFTAFKSFSSQSTDRHGVNFNYQSENLLQKSKQRSLISQKNAQSQMHSPNHDRIPFGGPAIKIDDLSSIYQKEENNNISIFELPKFDFDHKKGTQSMIQGGQKAKCQSKKKNGVKVELCCHSDHVIDLFALKILALLMCKGSLQSKAGLFIDTIIGRAGQNCGRSDISANNSRLKRGVLLLVYFSEIFPRKYWDGFEDEIVQQVHYSQQDQLLHLPMKQAPPINHAFSDQRSELTASQVNYGDNLETPRPTQIQNPKQTDTVRRLPKLEADEESKFAQLFSDWYEEVFLDLIFLQNECKIERASFVKTICKGNAEGGDCHWIFDPTKLRTVYAELFMEDKKGKRKLAV